MKNNSYNRKSGKPRNKTSKGNAGKQGGTKFAKTPIKGSAKPVKKQTVNLEGEKIRGTLRGNRKGFAFLLREDGGEDLFVPHNYLNGAGNKDVVDAVIVEGDTACVVDIITRHDGQIVGTFIKENHFGFVVPDNRFEIDDIYINQKNSKKIPNDTKVVVKIIANEEGKKKEGEIVEVIGPVSEKNSTVLSILKSHGFNEIFPASVIKEAEEVEYKYADGGKRKDFTDLLTVTIDGEDSKDFDDAISIKRTKNDGFELYVHIADVTHYVRGGSKLDKQALFRGTSVYFPGSVYPMLPEVLSNGICSLAPGEKRFCLTVKINLDSEGVVNSSEIFESVVKSDRRMTYNQVMEIIDGDKSSVKDDLRIADIIEDMLTLRNLRYDMRLRRGAIEFDSTETIIVLDEFGDVDRLEKYNYTVANSIIEEFMVLANECVAREFQKLKAPFVYRVHKEPDKEKIAEFAKYASGFGLEFDLAETEPLYFAEFLRKIKGQPYERTISKVMLRSMQKAIYDPSPDGHFGLALADYCHFTAPIRRYPDLMIHRIIKLHLNDELAGSTRDKFKEYVKEASITSSEREREAELAEREIDDFYKAEYMAKHIGEEFSGVISGVTSFGIFVELDNTCEGFVSMSDLPDDEYDFVSGQFKIVGTKNTYELGQAVNIVVIGAYPIDKRVDFKIVESEEVI